MRRDERSRPSPYRSEPSGTIAVQRTTRRSSHPIDTERARDPLRRRADVVAEAVNKSPRSRSRDSV
jgi:hypothetical protein